MRPRTRVVLAWALWLVSFGCCAAGLLITLAIYRPLTLAVLVEGAVYACARVRHRRAGAGPAAAGEPDRLAAGRPGSPAYTIPVSPWIDQLVREHRPLPLVAQVVAATGDLSWAPAITLGVTLPALLLQRPPPVAPLAAGRDHQRDRDRPGHRRRLRPGAAGGDGGRQPARAGRPGRHRRRGDRRRAAALGEPAAGGGLRGAAVPLLPGVERQQMRWVAAGVTAAVAGLIMGVPGGLGLRPTGSRTSSSRRCCPPVAVGVAVLRYRLYDLDRVVSRTLTYALLTLLLGLGYAAVVLGLGRLLPESSSLVVAAATLAVVAAFAPAPAGPGPGRPALQPPPLRRRRPGGVRGPPARPGRPGRPARRAAGRGRPDHAADPGLALAPPRSLGAVEEGFRSSGPWAMLGSGAVPRPTSSPVLTPPARGGKGDLEFSGRWSSALVAGAAGAWVPRHPRAEEHQMTKQKSFKGRVRARMDKTSESYTTARRQLLAKAKGEADPPPPRTLRPRPRPPTRPRPRRWTRPGEAALLRRGAAGEHGASLGRVVRAAGRVGWGGAAPSRDRAVAGGGARGAGLVGAGVTVGYERRAACGPPASAAAGSSR